jgi:hypothetical protein
VQLNLKSRDAEEPVPPPREYGSVIPGFPRITEDTYQDYYIWWAIGVFGMLLFGGLIAPLVWSFHLPSFHRMPFCLDI